MWDHDHTNPIARPGEADIEVTTEEVRFSWVPKWWQLRRRYRWWRLQRDVKKTREALSAPEAQLLEEFEMELERSLLLGDARSVFDKGQIDYHEKFPSGT